MAIATALAEMQQPVTSVAIVGIISSTVLTLHVLPALCRLFRKHSKRASPGDEDSLGSKTFLREPNPPTSVN